MERGRKYNDFEHNLTSIVRFATFCRVAYQQLTGTADCDMRLATISIYVRSSKNAS